MRKIIIVALLSLFAAAPAAADAGFYAGANAGSAMIKSSGLSSTAAFSVLGGYALTQDFAVEVAYSDFGSKSYPAVSNLKSSAVSISGVGSYPINSQFSLLGKLGLASTTVSATGIPSTTKNDWTIGVGGKIKVNEQVDMRLGFDLYRVRYPLATVNENVWTIGAVFKF